jgi:hypothetical protein
MITMLPIAAPRKIRHFTDKLKTPRPLGREVYTPKSQNYTKAHPTTIE